MSETIEVYNVADKTAHLYIRLQKENVKMGEYLPDGSYQHYTGPCPDCGEYVNVNIQGNIIDHKCSQSNKAINSDPK